jgi:DNA polymerase I-like protein with 3'-5' exonuclease and polymerase domains
MNTHLDFTAKGINPPASLIALLENSSMPNQVFIIDLVRDVAFITSDQCDIESIINTHLTIMANAKESLLKWSIAPHPTLHVGCLTTIKKLIAKHHQESLYLPDFSSSEEALPWIKNAAHEAFDRIKRLDMVDLIALECRVIPAVMAMERKGLPFDKMRWQDALVTIEAEFERLKHRLDRILPNDNGFLLFGPDPVDLQNNQAVKRALEKLIGTKLLGTSHSHLKNYDHEAVKLVLRYRECARMLSNYGEAFLAKIDHDRIKGHFIPIGSASGRFACHDTNLLALPNLEIFQACLVPKSPYVVMHFDYGAFELRILAALSGDETLIRIFCDKQDIHSMVAQEIFGVTVSKHEKAHLRDQAKVLNFGLIYGMGEQALAKQLKISKSEAQKLLQNYFKRFRRVHEFLMSLEVMAKTKGYVSTVLGRRVYFCEEKDNSHIARLARNVPIQGSGADIAKLALCRVYQRLHASGLDAHVINLVHDELVIEVHEEHQHEVEQLVVEEMTAAFAALCPAVPAMISKG